ncbi:unnamed protein product [Symbiodinium natans]|uniref:Uncharacterized protein n=1 Tax=Symbiodinium natans TaxID=878477 RepID=A0A812M3W6_9DINO|nr:unnamed protein product [Symbiodinium natans]
MVHAPVPLFLAYGDRHVEVLSTAGYDGIRRQAEEVLSLHPEAYDLCDAHGKVEEETFERAVACAKGFCVLQLREKPEWKKIRELETRLNKLEQVPAKPEMEEAETRTWLRIETMEKMIQDLAKKTQADALDARVEALEKEMTEQSITNSALNGHMECGIATAQRELKSLRQHMSDQLKSLDERLLEATHQGCGPLSPLSPLVEKLERVETELAEQSITSSAVNGHLEHGLATAQKELQGLREFTSDQLGSLDGRLLSVSESLQRLEATLDEQAVTNSALNGHLECGVATSRKELESLRVYAADQLKFLNERLDEVQASGKIPAEIGTQWSDGFTTHILKTKSNQSSLKSLQLGAPLARVNPVDRLLHLHASKSVPSLPAIR